ncbi:hypothetical protein TNCV_1947661, partial [Trichonephila clavipes]
MEPPRPVHGTPKVAKDWNKKVRHVGEVLMKTESDIRVSESCV